MGTSVLTQRLHESSGTNNPNLELDRALLQERIESFSQRAQRVGDGLPGFGVCSGAAGRLWTQGLPATAGACPDAWWRRGGRQLIADELSGAAGCPGSRFRRGSSGGFSCGCRRIIRLPRQGRLGTAEGGTSAAFQIGRNVFERCIFLVRGHNSRGHNSRGR